MCVHLVAHPNVIVHSKTMNAAKCLSESAVERIPIELWSKIINFLLRSPLVPHQDTTFVESLAMLSYGCDSEDLVRGWVQTSLPLRLVCHGWNLLVQRAAPILVRCNFDDRHVTAVPANVLPQPSDGKRSNYMRFLNLMTYHS